MEKGQGMNRADSYEASFSSSGDHKQKFYWGHKEILLPVYKNMADAMKKHPDVDVVISFASLRSAFDSTMETMQHPQVCSLFIPHPNENEFMSLIHIFFFGQFNCSDSYHRHHSGRHPRSPHQEDH